MGEENKVKGDVAAAIEAVREIDVAETIKLDASTVMSIPSGRKLVDLKPFIDARAERPERIKGIAKHTTLDSFINHVIRFKDDWSAIFASDDPKAPSLLAVFDYHAGSEQAGEEDNVPRFTEHRAFYSFPLSDEWKAWTQLPEAMSQGRFAELLEDRIGDILDPAAAGPVTRDLVESLGLTLATPARILALSRGLSVRVESRVANHTNLSTGEAQIAYEESHSAKDGGPLSIPGGVVIAIPVFRDGPLYQIAARLRYRIKDGSVSWRIALHRVERVFSDAFEQSLAHAAEATGLPVYHGTPES